MTQPPRLRPHRNSRSKGELVNRGPALGAGVGLEPLVEAGLGATGIPSTDVRDHPGA